MSAPEALSRASRTRYGSPARLYGRVTIDGHCYLYHKATDALVRQDLYPRYKEALKRAPVKP